MVRLIVWDIKRVKEEYLRLVWLYSKFLWRVKERRKVRSKGRKEKGGVGGEKEEGREEGRGRRKKGEEKKEMRDEEKKGRYWGGEGRGG